MTKIADATVDDISKFLDATFKMGKFVLGPELDDIVGNKANYMLQYAKMAKFLSDAEEVKTVSTRLSEGMGRLYTFAKSYAIRGAFSEVLKKVGPELGFSSDVLILNSQVSEETFAEAVFNRRLFRDVFTRPHGEFTHAIQWLLMALRFGNEFNVPTLYKYSVLYKSTAKFNSGKESKEIYMWNFLVDCFEGSGENYQKNIVCNTYRCPQYLTNNLYTLSASSWLGNFLYARRQKGLKGGEPNKPGGHYGTGREVTMQPSHVNRTVGGMPVYEKLNEDNTLLRKSLREEMGGFVQNGPIHPSTTTTTTANNDSMEMG